MSSVKENATHLLRLALSIARGVKTHLSDEDYGLGDVEWPAWLKDQIEEARSHPVVMRIMTPANYCSVLRVLYYFWELGGGKNEDVDPEDEDENKDENKGPSVTMLDLFRVWFEDAPYEHLKSQILPACILADGMNTFAPLPEGCLAVFLRNFHGQGCPGLVPIAAIVLMLELMRIENEFFTTQGDLVDLLLQLAKELIEHIKSHGTLFGGKSSGPAPVAAAAAAAASDDSSGTPQDPDQIAVKPRASAKRKADSPPDDEPASKAVTLQNQDPTEHIVGFHFFPSRVVLLELKLPDGTIQSREVPIPAEMVDELWKTNKWNDGLEKRAADLLSGKP